MIREIVFEILPSSTKGHKVRACVYVGLDKHLRDVFERDFAGYDTLASIEKFTRQIRKILS